MLMDRYSSLEMLEKVDEIERASFTSPLSIDSIKGYLESKNVYLFVDSDSLFGFLLLSIVAEEAEVLNIAVSPEKRGEGIGRKLLKEGFDFARSKGCTEIFLEVRQSNSSAITLYLSELFEETGRRKNYYSNPKEDAILMKKEL